MGISAQVGAGGEMFVLYASFWLCFIVNLKETQNSILHSMVVVAREPDLVLRANTILSISQSYLHKRNATQKCLTKCANL